MVLCLLRGCTLRIAPQQTRYPSVLSRLIRRPSLLATISKNFPRSCPHPWFEDRKASTRKAFTHNKVSRRVGDLDDRVAAVASRKVLSVLIDCVAGIEGVRWVATSEHTTRQALHRVLQASNHVRVAPRIKIRRSTQNTQLDLVTRVQRAEPSFLVFLSPCRSHRVAKCNPRSRRLTRRRGGSERPRGTIR